MPLNSTKQLEGSDEHFLDVLDRQELPKRRNGLNFVSFFCGGGGLDLGFALAGYKPVFSSDVEATYCDTIETNLPGHICEAHSVTDLDGRYIKKRVNQSVDIIIGGPPCQSFSILGDRKATADPRGKLVFDFVRLIKEIKPKAFLFENVPGIQNVRGGKDWDSLLSYMKTHTGYDIRWHKLNSASFGVPQFRERVFIIGFKKKANFSWPEPTHALTQNDMLLPPPRSSWQALEEIGDLTNHILREHSERVINRYSKIPPGKRDKVDHTDRIHPDLPSGTVLVGSGSGGGRPFIHPYENRHITVREAARLQSFPDWWKFSGGPTAAYRQVGNAVPPILAKHVAKQIAKVIKKL